MYTIEEVRLAISQWDETHDDVHLAMLTEYADLLAQREAGVTVEVKASAMLAWSGYWCDCNDANAAGNNGDAMQAALLAVWPNPTVQAVPDAKRLKALEQAMGEYADDTCRAPTWCAINLVNKRADEILRLEKRSD